MRVPVCPAGPTKNKKRERHLLREEWRRMKNVDEAQRLTARRLTLEDVTFCLKCPCLELICSPCTFAQLRNSDAPVSSPRLRIIWHGYYPHSFKPCPLASSTRAIPPSLISSRRRPTQPVIRSSHNTTPPTFARSLSCSHCHHPLTYALFMFMFM
jgi:hypothetical protein